MPSGLVCFHNVNKYLIPFLQANCLQVERRHLIWYKWLLLLTWKGFRLVYLHLTLAHSKGWDLGHVHFDSDNVKMVKDMSAWLMPSNIGFQFAHLLLTLTNSKEQCQGQAYFESEYLGNVQRTGNVFLLSSNRKSCMDFQFVYLHLIHSKRQA